MKLNAVGVTSSNLKKTVAFYTLLGFKFSEFKADEQHLEPETPDGSARLMIDTKNIVADIIGEDPKPGNHSSFAIEYDTPPEIDAVVQSIKAAGFTVVKKPWDAFWGQHYAVVADPDGYKVDLYARL
jgi:catechol 2,3-dioxygenase-like lactoylglutathione lyase family enzyme